MKPFKDTFGGKAVSLSKLQSLNIALGTVIAAVALIAFAETQTRAAALNLKEIITVGFAGQNNDGPSVVTLENSPSRGQISLTNRGSSPVGEVEICEVAALVAYHAESCLAWSAPDSFTPCPWLPHLGSLVAFEINVGTVRIDIPPRAPAFSEGALPTTFQACANPTGSSDPAKTDKGAVLVHGSLNGSLTPAEEPWRNWLR
ncbi:MAG: hypothetical protein P4L99_19135 [Chthoniobacter sp.]|nr:hypothetical protein [Chthoniobacter sp.]